MATHASDRQLADRVASLDVMRTIALFGIIVLNYHGYLNFQFAGMTSAPSIFERWWHPFHGVLANPFPVGFVMVAGMGVAMMTQTDAQNATAMRWRLARRGLFLFSLGYGIEWVWAGTILPYYGAYFLIAAVISVWSQKKLIALATFASLFAAGLQWWRIDQLSVGNLTAWLSPSAPTSPRDLLIRLFIDYTHPIFPWLTFFIVGILLGRSYPKIITSRRKVLFASVNMVAFAYFVNSVVNTTVRDGQTPDMRWSNFVSTRPLDRGLLYVTASLGVVITVFMIVTILCEKFSGTLIMRLAQVTGQMTLSIYLAHIFIYNIVVNQLKLVTPTGLDTAMVMSVVVYIAGVVWANWWQQRFGRGPAERLYRHFGG